MLNSAFTSMTSEAFCLLGCEERSLHGKLAEREGALLSLCTFRGPWFTSLTHGKQEMRRSKRQKAGSQSPTRTSVRSSSDGGNKEGGGRGWKRREKEGEGGCGNNGPFRPFQMKEAAGAEVKG